MLQRGNSGNFIEQVGRTLVTKIVGNYETSFEVSWTMPGTQCSAVSS